MTIPHAVRAMENQRWKSEKNRKLITLTKVETWTYLNLHPECEEVSWQLSLNHSHFNGKKGNLVRSFKLYILEEVTFCPHLTWQFLDCGHEMDIDFTQHDSSTALLSCSMLRPPTERRQYSYYYMIFFKDWKWAFIYALPGYHRVIHTHTAHNDEILGGKNYGQLSLHVLLHRLCPWL